MKESTPGPARFAWQQAGSMVVGFFFVRQNLYADRGPSGPRQGTDGTVPLETT